MDNFPPFDPSWVNWPMPFPNMFDNNQFPQPVQQYQQPVPQDGFGLPAPWPFLNPDFNFMAPNNFPQEPINSHQQYPTLPVRHIPPPRPLQINAPPFEPPPTRNPDVDRTSTQQAPQIFGHVNPVDGSDEEGEVKESSSAQPESFGKAERERNEVLRQVEKLKLRKGRKRPRTDQEKLAQHKADLLLLSDSSPEWQRKVEAYLAERPDLRTKGVHANLPQPSTSQPKVGSVKEAGSNKSAHNDHSSSRTNARSTQSQRPSSTKQMKAETSSGSDSDLSAVKKVLQQLDSMNLSSAELARMGVDLVAFDRYCQLLGLRADAPHESQEKKQGVTTRDSPINHHSSIRTKQGPSTSTKRSDTRAPLATSTSRIPSAGTPTTATAQTLAPKVRPAKAQAIASADRASPVTPTSKQSEVSRQAYGSVLPILSKHHDSSTPIAGKTEAKLPVLSRSEIIKQKLAGLNKVSSPSNESSKSRTQGDSVSESPLVRSDPPAKPVSEQAKSLLVSDALQPVVAKAPTTLSAVPDRAAIQAKKLALLQEKMALLRSVVVKKPAPVDTYLADSQRPAEIRTGGSDVHNQQNAAAALPPTTSIAPGFLDEAAGLERDKSAMDGNALNTPFQSFNFQLATAGIPGLSSAALSSGFNTPSTGNPYSTPHVTQSSLRKRPVAADFNDEFAEQAPPRKRRYERDNDDGVVIPLSDNEDHDSDISSSEEGEISSGHSTHSEVGSQRQMKSGKVLNSTPLAKPANVFVRSAMSLHSAPRIQSPLPRSSVLPSTLSGLDEKIRKLKEQLAKKESKRPLEVASIDPIQGPNTDAPILTEFDEAATQVVEMELDRLIEQEGRRPTPHPTGSLMASETVTEQEVPPQQADDDPTEDITSNSVPTSDQSHTFAAAQHSTVKVRDDVRLEPTTTDAISQESSPSAQSVSSGSLDSTSMEEGEVSSAAVSSIQSRAMSIEGSPAASPSALNSDSSDEPTRSDPVDDNTGLEGDVAEKNSILAVVNPLPGAVSHTQPLDSDIGAINPQAVAMSEPSPLSDSVAGSEEESVAAEAPEPRNPETQMADMQMKPAPQFKKDLTGYESPLLTLKRFRYHPRFLRLVEGGYLSLTFSHQIDPVRPLCPDELSLGACSDSNCTFQHFRGLRMDGDRVILQLGWNGSSGEDGPYKESLRVLLTDLRAQETSGFDQVTQAVVDHRLKFFGSWL